MNRSDINNYVGIIFVFIVIGCEIFLFMKVKNTWSDLSKRGNNIFYIMGMVFGLIGLTIAFISLIQNLWH